VGLGSPSGGALLPTYLVEAYTPPSRANQADTAERIARAADELGREGIRVAHRRTTFLADDDTSFYLFEAAATTAVSELCHRAGLGRVRIVRAVET
jgi:hypothetical protein